MSNPVDWAALAAPFPVTDIEWRVQSCGKNKKGFWARVVPHLTARAVQSRLDDVLGPENWSDGYKPGPDGGVLCTLSVRCGDEWISKADAAENTGQFEAVKGGISGALKRAAVKWGIGRYLYEIPECWAVIDADGPHRAKTKEGQWFNWSAPKLPEWAVPGGPQDAVEGKDRTESQPEAVRLLLQSRLDLDDLLAAAKRGFDVDSLRDLDEHGWAAMSRWVHAHIRLSEHALRHGVESSDLAAAVLERFNLHNLAQLSSEQIRELWSWIERGQWSSDGEEADDAAA